MKKSSRPPELVQARELIGTDSKKALKICGTYQTKNPSDPWVNQLIAMAQQDLGNYPAAYDAASNYIKYRPDFPGGYWSRSEISYEMGNYSQSINDAEAAISRDPDKILGSIPFQLAALSYAHQGDLAQALSMAERIKEKEPNQWYPPIGPLPAGTKAQFIETVKQVAQNVKPVT